MNLQDKYSIEAGNRSHEFGGVPKREYVEWLETINSEMIDALVDARELINEKYFIREGDSLVLAKIEQALKKAGCV